MDYKKFYNRQKHRITQEAKNFLKDKKKLNLSFWDYIDYLDDLKRRAKKWGMIKELKNLHVL